MVYCDGFCWYFDFRVLMIVCAFQLVVDYFLGCLVGFGIYFVLDFSRLAVVVLWLLFGFPIDLQLLFDWCWFVSAWVVFSYFVLFILLLVLFRACFG